MSQDLLQIGDTNLLVFLLVVLFAISSWIDINGLWVELPIMVQQLPEGWHLPSYMAVIIQVANIAPLVYTVTRTVSPQRRVEIPIIYAIIITGAVACLLLPFFWDATAVVAGEPHSVGLLSLQFFLALVDCTSSVAYLPFMGGFKPQYLTAFYIGEGLSGLLPSIVSLAQGAGNMYCYNQTSYTNITVNGVTTMATTFISYPVYETPRFSIKVFFLFLFAMLVLSCVAFSLLTFWGYAARGRVDFDPSEEGAGKHHGRASYSYLSSTSTGFSSTSYELSVRTADPSIVTSEILDANSGDQLLPNQNPLPTKDREQCASVSVVCNKHLNKKDYVGLLVLTAWVNALTNGILPSIQSYSCLPYGIQAFHLAVTLASVANPAACFLALCLQARSLYSVTVVASVGSLFSGYIVFTAASSPAPPLSTHPLGPVTVVAVWVLAVFVLTHTKVSMAAMFRQGGKKALLWCGAITQVGSLAGALTTFFLVNLFQVFKQANLCN